MEIHWWNGEICRALAIVDDWPANFILQNVECMIVRAHLFAFHS